MTVARAPIPTGTVPVVAPSGVGLVDRSDVVATNRVAGRSLSRSAGAVLEWLNCAVSQAPSPVAQSSRVICLLGVEAPVAAQSVAAGVVARALEAHLDSAAEGAPVAVHAVAVIGACGLQLGAHSLPVTADRAAGRPLSAGVVTGPPAVHAAVAQAAGQRAVD